MKYIIELREEANMVQAINVTQNGTVYIDAKYVTELKELNSDYINEHFGDLQDTAYDKGYAQCQDDYGDALKHAKDTAYQKGFEDGKAVHERGCEGCLWEGSRVVACTNCCNAYKNKWIAKDDKIEVGDEVTHKSDSVVWTAVCIQIDVDGRHMNLMGHTGAVGYYPVDDFKKTGRHFDIASILEAMKHD